MKIKLLLIAMGVAFITMGFVSESTPAQNDEVIVKVENSTDNAVISNSVPQVSEADAYTFSSNPELIIVYDVEVVKISVPRAIDLSEGFSLDIDVVPIKNQKNTRLIPMAPLIYS